MLIYLAAWLAPHKLGTTMGDHVVYQYYHRGTFLGALPVLGAIGGTIYGQLLRHTDEAGQHRLSHFYFHALALLNVTLLLGMAAAWPESCVANPLVAIIAAVVMSGASTKISTMLSGSFLDAPPVY